MLYAGQEVLPDDARTLCSRLREGDADTCERFLHAQAVWWRAFGSGRCLVVGPAAAGKRQGFIINAFPFVLRMHSDKLQGIDVGSPLHGVRCTDGADCVRVALEHDCRAEDGTLLSVGTEPSVRGVRTLLGDVYAQKLGVFGGPPKRVQPAVGRRVGKAT
jgi:hypothetical protein